MISRPMLKNWIVYIVGPPGVGKLTTAKELARVAGCMVVDNHYWLNPIFGLIQQDGVTPLPKGIWPLADRVRSAVLETIAVYSPPDWSFAFTHAAVADPAHQNRSIADELASVGRRRGANMLAVRLSCGAEELARRIAAPGRRELMKEADVGTAFGNAALGPFDPGWPLTMTIETTNLAVEETVKRIVSQISGATRKTAGHAPPS